MKLIDLAKKAFEIGSKFVGDFAEPLAMLMGRQAFGSTPHRGDSAIAEALSNNSDCVCQDANYGGVSGLFSDGVSGGC
ncbi:hypothetical protein OOK60_16385 [Trichothermofontia sichuanensis B231]|uniref:hypothetical protein n=1 Tax=Trichothermofontia sichuanensis TaxID=3045816 RepID=UPI0022486299|nr:hypothetical protein [Trichothermofontia sichuanensis]UZQ54048.1 hypothetical protein OOK60_16385 [Trichothermofontia sichuanensis B231]